MKAYFFNEYRDKAGSGSYKMFDAKEDAIAYCVKEWDDLCKADKESYLNDSAPSFCVEIAEVVEEDGEKCMGESEGVVFDALEEYRKEEADKITSEWGGEISFAAAVALMDDEIREAIHAEGFDEPQAFYNEYCRRHEEEYSEEFTI